MVNYPQKYRSSACVFAVLRRDFDSAILRVIKWIIERNRF